MAKGHMFWHAPEWFLGSPSTSVGIANVGADIIVELVNTEDVSSLAQDNFVVERVIGQYKVVSNDATPLSRYLHHRVYVTMGDSASLNLRTLSTADDADTSFTYHKVEHFTVGMHNNVAGSWAVNEVKQVSEARLGAFDIRVGRLVKEGTSLIWHTEILPTPSDDEFAMQMWVRVLLREA